MNNSFNWIIADGFDLVGNIILMYNDTIEHQLNNKDIIKDISEKDQLIMPQEKLELKTVNA